jgi:hypothetical protein
MLRKISFPFDNFVKQQQKREEEKDERRPVLPPTTFCSLCVFCSQPTRFGVGGVYKVPFLLCVTPEKQMKIQQHQRADNKAPSPLDHNDAAIESDVTCELSSNVDGNFLRYEAS